MKIPLGAMLLIFVGLAGWRIGETLHPDAVGMLIGMLFGMLAGIPATLMIIASHQQPPRQRYQDQYRPQQQPRQPRLEVHHHHHYHGDEKQTVDQLLEELEEIEWVRQLSRASAPKRITTNQYSNSKEW